MENKLRIAVVDDELREQKNISGLLARYGTERNITIEVVSFSNGQSFLDSYKPEFYLILMDIEMPYLDGLRTAHRLREIDPSVPLVFITRMTQYAVNGYEYSALDYIVKPVTYGILKSKLDYVFRRIETMPDREQFIFLNLGTDSFLKVRTRDICYVVKDRNYLNYVARDGEYRTRGTMKDAEDCLAGSTIVKIASGCMVNLRHIEKKVRSTVYIHGMQFTVTKPYQDAFTSAFMQYLRGNAR